MGKQQRHRAQNDGQATDVAARLRSANQYKTFMRRLRRAIDADIRRQRFLPPSSSPDRPLIVVRDPEEVLKEHFAKTWRWVRQHAVFQILTSSPNFGRAWMAFQHWRGPTRWEAPQDRRRACKFVWAVALWLYIYPLARDTRLFRRGTTAVDSETRKRTRSAVRRLQALLQAGCEPSDIERTLRMQADLEHFEHELTAPSRKTYTSDQDAQKAWLHEMARWFVHDLGSIGPAVLTAVAAIVDFSVDPGTVKRAVQRATAPR